MTGLALIQGASRGLGLALTRAVLARTAHGQVFATCREPEQATELAALRAQYPGRLTVLALDVTREADVARAAELVRRDTDRLHLLLNVAGVLHGPGFGPEKKISQVDPDALHRMFSVNAFGPLLVAKHFHGLLRHDERSVFASLSARIGSISDNRLGGWYAYRGSKAAQNMFTKTLSIELGRVAPRAIVVGLHPGTVDTDLSKPFQKGVPLEQLLPPARSADALLRVIDDLTEQDTGKVFDFRGLEISP
ncbi:MAG: SDR family oxidoreductase [Myxococcales bacterium]|jgi:NAD(P)-dependent dehydrogenase (short-subunit alcohol dehydrogenase family)